MKIVRLVLLLSLVGVSAACTDLPATGPDASKPLFDGSTKPDSTARDGSGGFGSGT